MVGMRVRVEDRVAVRLRIRTNPWFCSNSRTCMPAAARDMGLSGALRLTTQEGFARSFDGIPADRCFPGALSGSARGTHINAAIDRCAAIAFSATMR